jgi:hypothetical protein
MDRKTGACVDMDRFQRLDWPIQMERILAFCRKWRGLLVMDATGAGDPIYDDLARVWPRIEAVRFTNQKKVELIQRLVVAIEQRQASWPAAWETLTDELKRHEYAIGSSGTITYSAPSGFHDDAVIALALGFTICYEHAHALRTAELARKSPRNGANSSHRSLAAHARTLG